MKTNVVLCNYISFTFSVMSYKNTMNIVRMINNNNRSIKNYNIFKKLSYTNVEYKVSENDTLIHALMRFSLFNTTRLVVVDTDDNIVGSFSQKKYMKNISWLEGKSDSIYMGDIIESRYHDSIANYNTDLLTCYDKIIRYNLNEILILDNDDSKKFDIVLSNDIIHNIINSIKID